MSFFLTGSISGRFLSRGDIYAVSFRTVKHFRNSSDGCSYAWCQRNETCSRERHTAHCYLRLNDRRSFLKHVLPGSCQWVDRLVAYKHLMLTCIFTTQNFRTYVVNVKLMIFLTINHVVGILCENYFLVFTNNAGPTWLMVVMLGSNQWVIHNSC